MEQARKLHPLLTTAAVSMIVFAGVGVAAITGLIPTSKGSVAEPAPLAAVEAPAPEPVNKPQAVKKAPRPAKHIVRVQTPALTPPPPPVLAQAPQQSEAPRPVVKPGRLGTVESVREVEDAGKANGIGAVGGGVAGAVLGHNIGDHNKLVTVLGAAGGALLGNHIEKQARATKHWELTLRLDNGATETIRSEAQPAWRQGDRVRLLDGELQPV